LRVAFQGSRVTSDGGLLLVRELDERLDFGGLIEQLLADARGKNIQLPLTGLVRHRGSLGLLCALTSCMLEQDALVMWKMYLNEKRIGSQGIWLLLIGCSLL
jgi:hypothetical protein